MKAKKQWTDLQNSKRRGPEEESSHIWEAEAGDRNSDGFQDQQGRAYGGLSDLVECWGLSKELGSSSMLQKGVQDSIYVVLQTISYKHTP